MPVTDRISEFATESGVVCNLEDEGFVCSVPQPEFAGGLDENGDWQDRRCPRYGYLGWVDLELAQWCGTSGLSPAPVLPPGSITAAHGFTCSVEADAVSCVYPYPDGTLRFRFGTKVAEFF